MSFSFRWTFAVLFFLEFFILGTYQPLMSLYCMDYLSLSGFHTGLILSTSTIAAFLAPSLTMILADRHISSEKLLGVLELLSGLFLVMISGARTLVPLFFIYLMVNIFIHPTSALLNAITFKNLGTEGKNFASVRVWGTLGWIGAAVFFTFFWLNPKVPIPFQRDLSSIFTVASVVAFILGTIVFTTTGRKKNEKPTEKNRAIVKLTIPKGKEIWGFFFLCFLISSQDKYYFLGISPFLKSIGVKESNIMFIISIGMMSEVFFMIILKKLLGKFGMKGVMTMGAGASCIRYLIFIISSSSSMIIFGIFFHGMIFALYMAVAIIYLDTFCSQENRAAIHQFYSIITFGAGSFVGNLTGGIILDFSLSFFENYILFWTFPGILSSVVIILIPRCIQNR